MASELESSFQAAVNVVRSMPKKGSFQPSYDMMLKFYGLYKQATFGECKDSKPGFWDMVGKAKWDAWSALGSMSRQDAMEKYVEGLKQVMATMPQTEDVAEFTQVLKSFYDAAYDESEEHIPAVYNVLRKKKLPHNDESILKENGLVSLSINAANSKLPNGDIMHDDRNGSKEMVAENGTDTGCHKQYNSKVNKGRTKEVMHHMNGGVCSGNERKKVTFEEKPSHDKSEQVKLDSGGQENGFNNGYTLPYSSEDSDDEFCDSLDPENMAKPMPLTENILLGVSATSPDGSPSNGSSTNSTFTESDISENDITNSLLTSTPQLPKRGLHVKFDLENDKAVYNKGDDFACEPVVMPTTTSGAVSSELATVNMTQAEVSSAFPEEGLNGEFTDRSSTGILKPYTAGSGGGAGDPSSVHPTGRPVGRSPRQRHYGTASSKNGRGVTSHVGGGYRRQSDTDSEDDHPGGDDYDSTATERDDERVLLALERLQQDMNSVLRRLSSVEEALVHRRESREPWWIKYLPSKTVIFCAVWPILVNLAFKYFKRRKEEREILRKARFFTDTA